MNILDPNFNRTLFYNFCQWTPRGLNTSQPKISSRSQQERNCQHFFFLWKLSIKQCSTISKNYRIVLGFNLIPLEKVSGCTLFRMPCKKLFVFLFSSLSLFSCFSSMPSLFVFVVSFAFIPLIASRLEWLIPTLQRYDEWAEEEEEVENKRDIFIIIFVK